MLCPRCSIVNATTHEISRPETAKEWVKRDVLPHELPIKVYQQTAKNGRVAVIVCDRKGKRIAQR